MRYRKATAIVPLPEVALVRSIIDGMLNFWTSIIRGPQPTSALQATCLQLERAFIINRAGAATKKNTNFRTASASKTDRDEIRA